MMNKYLPAHTCDCTFSLHSAEMAIQLCGPAFVYRLVVSQKVLVGTRRMLREWCADVKDNPLAPYINLETDALFDENEWMLEANGKAYGSKGC